MFCENFEQDETRKEHDHERWYDDRRWKNK